MPFSLAVVKLFVPSELLKCVRFLLHRRYFGSNAVLSRCLCAFMKQAIRMAPTKKRDVSTFSSIFSVCV